VKYRNIRNPEIMKESERIVEVAELERRVSALSHGVIVLRERLMASQYRIANIAEECKFHHGALDTVYAALKSLRDDTELWGNDDEPQCEGRHKRTAAAAMMTRKGNREL